MSAEYAARMEVLQRKREELTARRQAVEKRMALREATAAEFSAVALQSYKQKWKTQRSAAVAAKKRNEEFVRMLQATQKQVHDTWARLHSDQSSSNVGLAHEKARYNQRVEQIYPAWQEQLQRQRVQKLKELEDKKRKVERRRYLAKKSFEKEQTLDDLIRKTRHEVEMAESLEQNELYERELLRTQSTNQAKDVNNSIREVALEARNHLQQQAAIHFEATPEIDEELADRLSETFSPRNALRALREGNSSLAFNENLQYEEEKPARQIRVEIPACMNASPYYRQFSQQDLYQGYPVEKDFDDDYADGIPRELNERPSFFGQATADRYQRSTDAGNDFTNFRQAISTDSPATRDPPSRAAKTRLATVSEPVVSQTVSCIEALRMDQRCAAPSNISVQHVTPTSQPNVLQVSPMVTGQLYPIPEVNEPISPVETRPNDTGNVRISETISIPDRDHATGSRNNFTIPSSSSTTAVEIREPFLRPPTNTFPDKIEENRVAISPSAFLVAPIHPGDTSHASVDEDRPIEYQERVLTPEPSFKPPAISIPKLIEPPVLRLSITETNAENPSEVQLQKSTDELGCKTEGEVDLLAQYAVGGGDDYSMGADNTLSQLDVLSNTNTSGLPAEDQYAKYETGAKERNPSKHVVEFEVVPRPSLANDTIDVLDTLDQDFDNKIDSFHGKNSGLGTKSATRLVPDVPALTTVEAPVRSVNKKTATTVPRSSSISYSLDLLEPFTPLASTPVHKRPTEDDMMLSSMQSDDFDLSASSIKPTEEPNPTVPSAIDAPVRNDVVAESHASSPQPPSPVPEEVNMTSITEKLSPVDRVKALGALISRVEEGATEGDTLSGSMDTGSSSGSKRDLLKMAVGGFKAQVAFFGSDICFELILDISRDLGSVLFPPKAFEGIMNDQKIRKLHQSNKEKQLDLWKALAGHLKQLVQLKAIPAATLVDLFVAAFLAHNPDNQRSQRKLREFLIAVCGGDDSKHPNPRKEASTASPSPSPPRQGQRTPSSEPAKHTSEDRIGTPSLLQTAFLQRQSPPKPKVFGIASSSFKDRSSGSSDVLMSMSSGPMKLSQKLMRGGKMNDYSEFEEEEEVDLQNLIGTKPSFSSGSSALGRSYRGAKTSPTGKSTTKQTAVEEEDEFDADF
ncbi:hypothetical protein V7S43_001681 [Phytophthora oleae]|uniref:Centrosomal protein POC5 n=1 Tax=Phytophthora oleae TaxID=2107226 RepID=A0ABD3G5Z2_9STRA